MDPDADPSAAGESDDEVTNVLEHKPRIRSAQAQEAALGPRARRCPTCRQAFSGEARFCPFDGDPLVSAPDWNPAADPLRGKVIDGRYEVLSVLGEGGMGTVYEVRHVALGRRFALKVLRRDIADAEHAARFIREAKAAAAIGHPNIVAVSDFGEITLGVPGTPAVPYFVMEFLVGNSLAALLRAERTIPPQRAAAILVQCASGLAAAHAAGVVHRDLKPDNVFLIRNGEREFVKLLDFGVAKMAGAGRLTRAGMVFGTPHYMSPEQAAGQSVDHRADIYALGVILYECLTGRVPFEADTYMGVLTKHMFASPEPIEQVAPDASNLGALAPIAMRCLAKSPHERFQTMDELAAAIEAAIAEPARAAAPAHGARSSSGLRLGSDERFEGRIRVPETPGLKPIVGRTGLAVGVVALALGGLLAWTTLRSSPSSTAAPASSAPAEATATASSEPVAQPPSTVEAAAPDAPAPTAAEKPAPAEKVEPRATTDGAKKARTADTKKVEPPPVRATPTRPPPRRGDVVDPWAN